MTAGRQVAVKGRCPACLEHALVVGDDGRITCTTTDCIRPDAAHELIGEVADSRLHGAFTFCSQLVGHASMREFAVKISQKHAAYADAVKFKTALEQLRAEVRMLCNCCGNNRDRMRRIHVLLGLPTTEFDLTEEDNEG